MKVIRLIEAEYEKNDSGLLVPKSNDKATDNSTETSEPKDQFSDVDVNEVRRAFEKGSKDEGQVALEKLLNNIVNYGKNDAKNVGILLKGFKPKFVKYALECLGYENLGDKNNTILMALANPAAKPLLNGNENLFSVFFNNLNGELKDLDADYLKDSNALIFNRDLYRRNNNDTVVDIILNDNANKDNSEWRKAAIQGISTGNVGQFARGTQREDRQAAQATEIFNGMSDERRLNWFTSKGVEKPLADKVLTQIKAYENSNNK